MVQLCTSNEIHEIIQVRHKLKKTVKNEQTNKKTNGKKTNTEKNIYDLFASFLPLNAS